MAGRFFTVEQWGKPTGLYQILPNGCINLQNIHVSLYFYSIKCKFRLVSHHPEHLLFSTFFILVILAGMQCHQIDTILDIEYYHCDIISPSLILAIEEYINDLFADSKSQNKSYIREIIIFKGDFSHFKNEVWNLASQVISVGMHPHQYVLTMTNLKRASHWPLVQRKI